LNDFKKSEGDALLQNIELRNVMICFANVMALVVIGLGGPGCVERECLAINDCPSGSYCDSGQCVSTGATPSTGGSGGNAIPGGGSPIQDDFVTDYPIDWIGLDSRNGGSDLLYSHYNGSTVDRVLSFELDTDDFPGDITMDFIVAADGNCAPSEIVFEDNISTSTSDTEQWMVCAEAPYFRIVYDNQIEQPALLENAAVDFGIPIISSANGEYDDDRRMWAGRGTGTIESFQLRENDVRGVERNRDDMSALSFSAVTQMWQIESDVLGDMVLVFERTSPPTIRPIFRQHNRQEWVHNSSGLTDVELPVGTHAVVLIDDIYPDGTAFGTDKANIMTIEPEAGKLSYYAYGPNTDSLFLVDTLFYEFDSSHQLAPPSGSKRLLLAESPGQNAVFYTHQNDYRIWRLPLTVDSGAETLIFTAQDSRFSPSAIGPIDSDELWVSYPDERRFMRVKLED
jgi:hypothetical protein